jgi:hypothetical protein
MSAFRPGNGGGSIETDGLSLAARRMPKRGSSPVAGGVVPATISPAMPVAAVRNPDPMQPLADFHSFRARNFLTLLLRQGGALVAQPSGRIQIEVKGVDLFTESHCRTMMLHVRSSD